MALESFRAFHKSLQRIRLLYEVTIHSYQLVYESGRERLRKKEARDEKVEIKLQDGTVKRHVKIFAFQARDVYPQLLRSTLLIRLVAAYEAFLIDTIEEVAQRSDEPFISDRRLDLPQAQVLALDRDRAIKQYIVEKTTRQLTSGGLEEIRRFYSASLKTDVLAPGQSLSELEEIHERRHLYVHRGGYADRQYCHRFQQSGYVPGQLLPVDEPYLLKAIDVLYNSALHVRNSAQSRYPNPPSWRYESGDQPLAAEPPLLVLASARAANPAAIKRLTDLDTVLGDGTHVRKIVIWVGTDERHVKWLVGGSRRSLKAFFRYLHSAQEADDLSQLESVSIKR